MNKIKASLIKVLVMTACLGFMVQGVKADAQSVVSSSAVTIYGFVHVDASYSTGMIPAGNFAVYASSGSKDPDFNLTANATRLGFKLNTFDTEESALRGKIEVDFYGALAFGGATVSNAKAPIRMRLAYLEMVWKKMDMSLLAGQHWDVASPIIPPTVNFGINWYAGNPGYRHPQIRLTKDMGPLQVKVAVLRPMINNNDSTYTQEAPMVQGSLGYSVPMGEKKGYIGLSGHWSSDETGSANAKVYNEAHMISLDLNIPLGDMLAVKGEAWQGTNLETIMGGIGQGVAGGDSLNTKGGWLSLSIMPMKGTSINLIGGIDTVQEDQLGVGGRTQNIAAAINLKTKVMKAVTWGIEVSQWSTQYKDMEDGEALRLQSTMMYSF